MVRPKKEEAKQYWDGTITAGITGAAAFGAAVSATFGVSADLKGNVGLSLSVNGGAGFPNVSLGQSISWSNAPSINHLKGLGAVAGVSGGAAGLGGGLEYNMVFDQDNDKTYHGATISAGYGFYPTIIEVHGEVGYTWVWGWNYYDIAISLVEVLIFE